MKTDWESRRDIVAFAKRLYHRELIAATDGNVSVRMDIDRFMITAAGTSFATIQTGDVAYIDQNGYSLDYSVNPSSELPMHLEIYRQRPDINAIIHAHPPYTVATTLVGLSMSEPVLPESLIMLGDIVTAQYATPSTHESADSIRSLIKDHDVILLDHHGAVTCGNDLTEAYNKMEKLEYSAKTLISARSLGTIKPLTEENIQKLKNLVSYKT